jgi:predicted glutamine amidotransferase
MCIIAIKKEGVDMPSDAIIKKMFRTNKDGAGYAIKKKRSKLVKVSKGHMTIDAFMKAIKKEKINKTDIVVMHFRITTAGGTSPNLTHPFIADKNVEMAESLEASTDQLVMFHNGTISDYKGVVEKRSDSSLLATQIMSDQAIRENLTNSAIVELITLRLGSSRLAVIDPKKHNVFIFGGWSAKDKKEYKWNEAKDGMIYSNFSWEVSTGKVFKGFGSEQYGDGDSYKPIGLGVPAPSTDDEEDSVGFPPTLSMNGGGATGGDTVVIMNDFKTLSDEYKMSFLNFLDLSENDFIKLVKGGMSQDEYIGDICDWCNHLGLADGTSTSKTDYYGKK